MSRFPVFINYHWACKYYMYTVYSSYWSQDKAHWRKTTTEVAHIYVLCTQTNYKCLLRLQQGLLHVLYWIQPLSKCWLTHSLVTMFLFNGQRLVLCYCRHPWLSGYWRLNLNPRIVSFGSCLSWFTFKNVISPMCLEGAYCLGSCRSKWKKWVSTLPKGQIF